MADQTGVLSKYSRVNGLLVIVSLGVLIAGNLSNPFTNDASRDSGIFLYIGSLILKGKMPYVAAWENKGPLVFYINALGLFIANGSRWGIWFMEFLFLFMAGWVGYRMIRRQMGELPAVVGTFIWILSAGNVMQGGNLSEEYALLFGFAGAFWYWKSIEAPANKYFPFLVGCSLGLNILLRPNNIGMQVAIFFAYGAQAWFSKGWRLFLQRLVGAAIGAAAILIPVCVYFVARGAFAEMIKVALLFNVQYSSSNSLGRVLDGFATGAGLIGLPYILLAGLGYITVVFSIFIKSGDEDRVSRNFLFFLAAGWPIETVLSTLSGRNYPHYFISWAPHLALLGSYFIYTVIKWLRPKLRNLSLDWHANYVLLVFLFIFCLANLPAWEGYQAVLERVVSEPRSGLDYAQPVATYIRANTLPEDKVLVWGFRPIIYFASGREAPGSFLPYPLIHVDTPLARTWADQFFTQLTSNPPVLIIDVVNIQSDPIPSLNPAIRQQQVRKGLFKGFVIAPNLGQVLDFIQKNYTHLQTLNGYPVYRLNSSQ